MAPTRTHARGRALREEMVRHQIERRGLRSPQVLDALRSVPREEFVPAELREFAYEDAPLPIGSGQTISQPYIVAYMTDALELRGGERVLEIGTGSGYAAAVLGEIAREVHTIERHADLARQARERLERAGYDNVHVHVGDGTRGHPDAAPYDAIVVAAGGPEVPRSLRQQLAPGGRLVIPVGREQDDQRLVRVTRDAHGDGFREEELVDVRFVPLVGAEGWEERDAPARTRARGLAGRVAEAAEPFQDIDDAELGPLLERIGDARVVLLGEASHGSSEFYRMRAAITRALVEQKGFRAVAVEADWPDAARIDHYVRDRDVPPSEWQAFGRFPTWMWRNAEVREFVDWLHTHNAERPPEERVRFAGLDLYGLYHSIDAVLDYLDAVDPEAARAARERYGCLTPWQADPAVYGRAATTGSYRSCEPEVVRELEELLARRVDHMRRWDERYFEAVQNARLVESAERYYRVMYYGARESWNLRDEHMFQTLENLLDFHGPESRVVVWEHNSHVGDARATEMSARGELNIGQLCRERFGHEAYIVGFGTHRGTVAAATHWGGDMQVKRVLPSREDSYERLCHDTELPAFLLPLRVGADEELRRELLAPRLERAIGVIYRPESERLSHYFHARLPEQFDEYVWLDETSAVRPLDAAQLAGVPETYPFGL